MKFILRDDDISYYTKLEEVYKLYENAINNGLKVNFSVIPKAQKVFDTENKATLYHETEKRNIEENKELVTWLRDKVKAKKIEILLHGYDHSFSIKQNNEYVLLTKELVDITRKNKNIYDECCYKKAEILKKEIKEGKERLEDIFNTKINVFVPPANLMSKQCSKIIVDNNMNISGSIKRNFNRKIDAYSIRNYIKKSIWKFSSKNLYPYMLKYAKNNEIDAHEFTPSIDIIKFDKLVNELKNKNISFSVFTHYWQLQKKDYLYKYYIKMINEFKDNSILISDYL